MTKKYPLRRNPVLFLKYEGYKISNLYIGLMSGTSLDGVDVVLCEITSKQCRLVDAMEYPFDAGLKQDIMQMIHSSTSLAKVGEIDHRLGQMFADAVNLLVMTHSLERDKIIAIGSHGQTMWHAPDGDYPFSMQLGDPNIITAKTGIKVIADFRRKDIALGGQGAPFAPAFHRAVFQDIKQRAAVVNIGGMANITLLDEPFLGYDTGPGNVLMDMWIAQHKGLAFDNDGLWAKGGSPDLELLNDFFREPFFMQVPPKSTGRERFNAGWLEEILKRHTHLNIRDIQATLLELTVHSIADDIKKYQLDLLLICGGGARNGFLMERLSEVLPTMEVSSTDAYGVSSDSMEAMAFAWLAYKRVHRETVDLKAVTGAKENAILGGIYE